MATNEADLQYLSTPPDAEYEHTDIDTSIAGKFALWLAIAMILSGGIVYGTFWLFEGRQQAFQEAAQRYPLAVGQTKEPPLPHLQTQPFKDVWQLKQGQLERLNSYGWVDQGAGVVHVPIDDAMQRVLERNAVQAGSEPPPADFNHRVQDSSAGRTSAPR